MRKTDPDSYACEHMARRMEAESKKRKKAKASRYEEAKALLVEAWSHGIDGRKAAIYAKLTQVQYEEMMSEYEELRDLRAIELERPLIEAEMAVVDRIKKGELKASTWYLERMEPERFGNRDKVEVKQVDVPVREKEEQVLEFLKDLKPEVSFDFEVERLKPVIGAEDIRPAEVDDRLHTEALQEVDGIA